MLRKRKNSSCERDSASAKARKQLSPKRSSSWSPTVIARVQVKPKYERSRPLGPRPIISKQSRLRHNHMANNVAFLKRKVNGRTLILHIISSYTDKAQHTV